MSYHLFQIHLIYVCVNARFVLLLHTPECVVEFYLCKYAYAGHVACVLDCLYVCVYSCAVSVSMYLTCVPVVCL